MTVSRYQTINATEMENLLVAGGFSEVNLNRVRERVYDRPFVNAQNLVIRVYTTIDDSEVSRGYGQDAIRVCLIDTKLNRPVGRQTSTKRTIGWDTRLKDKINDTFKSVNTLQKCGKCGSYMVERKVKNGVRKGTKFLGCSNYPTCK